MKRLFVLVAALALAGCGDDSSAPMATDMAVVADLSVSADLMTLTCANVLSCVVGCGQNLVCQNGCRQSGSTAAKGLFDAYGACLVLTCSPVDGGVQSCTSPTDNSSTCRTCLANAGVQSMTTGGACHTEYSACASN